MSHNSDNSFNKLKNDTALAKELLHALELQFNCIIPGAFEQVDLYVQALVTVLQDRVSTIPEKSCYCDCNLCLISNHVC